MRKTVSRSAQPGAFVYARLTPLLICFRNLFDARSMNHIEGKIYGGTRGECVEKLLKNLLVIGIYRWKMQSFNLSKSIKIYRDEILMSQV